ncbi:MAG: hypothetical protein JWQ09_426 [Segetibacter sp.]|nr:hypothetical protein [Segetibacter sp.]
MLRVRFAQLTKPRTISKKLLSLKSWGNRLQELVICMYARW